MYKAFGLIYCLMLVGCATAQQFNSLSLGMSKSEVIQALGSPYSVSAKDGVEYMKYSYKPSVLKALTLGSLAVNPSETGEYFVRLVNGKVEAYGKVGDFDSTKNPARDINLTVKHE